MLRRILLAASASDRVRQFVTTAPYTRGVVARFVAGDTADDAIGVTRRLLADGLLVSLDYLGEDTADPDQAAAVADEYVGLLRRLGSAGNGPAMPMHGKLFWMLACGWPLGRITRWNPSRPFVVSTLG